jgi:hypothetical protein
VINGVIALATGGTERLRVISSGNVGIGVTSPGSPLEIAAESTNVGNTLLSIGNAILNPNTRDSWIKMYGSQATVDKTFAVGNMYGKFVVNYLGTRATNPESGGTKMFAVDGSTGNVGIGTTNPGTKLDVLVGGTNHIQLGASALGSTGDYIGGLYYSSNKLLMESFLVGTGYQDILLSPNGGNVGIGTTSPLAKTHIKASNAGGDSAASGTLIVEQGSSPSIQLLSANSQTQTIKFADPQSSQIGRISYSHPNDAMFFVTNGSEQVRIDSSGNVGIGTDNPTQDLTLYRSSGDTNFLISSNNGASQIFFGDTESDNIGRIDYDHSDNSLNFAVNADERMRITSAGNVGIGTTSPTVNLQVYDASSSQLKITNGLATPVDLQLFASSSSYAGIGTASNHRLALRTNNTEKVTILANGNVGIGTTSPAYKLDVVGAINSPFENGYYTGTNRALTQTITGIDGITGLFVGFVDYYSKIAFDNANSGTIHFLAGNSVAERMTIRGDSGNVGIGTTTPDSTLTVKATVDSRLGGIGWKSNDGTNEWTIDAPNAGNFRIYKGATAIARFDSSGNFFGIGTTIEI